MAYRIGIDLGGTKTEIVAMDSAGQIVQRLRVPTPGGDYEATLRVLASLEERGLLVSIFNQCWANKSIPKDRIAMARLLGVSEDALNAANHCKFDYIGPVTIPSLGVEGAF